MECQGAQTSSKVNREEILREKKDKHNTNRTEDLKITFSELLNTIKMTNQGTNKN